MYKSTTIKLMMMGLVYASSSCVQAETFTTLEAGYIKFKDFQAVSSNEDMISESAYYQSITAGLYATLPNKRTALLGILGAQNVAYEQTAVLDNQTASFQTGVYQLFQQGRSLLWLVGIRQSSFEEEMRDDLIGSTSLRYTHPIAVNRKLHFQAFYEQGFEETINGQYSGYGLSTTLSWAPTLKWNIDLGLSYGINSYALRERLVTSQTVNQDTAGAQLSLSRDVTSWLYATSVIAHRSTRSETIESVSGESATVGLGVNF